MNLVEYKFAGVPWRVERFDLLAGEFASPERPFTADDLPVLHEVLHKDLRRWRLVRLLHGIRPVLAYADADPDELRVWSADELCTHDRLTRPQLKTEIEAARGVFLGAARQRPEVRSQKSEVRSQKAEPKTELDFTTDEQYLAQFGIRWELKDDERGWFVERVRALEPVLKLPNTGELTRQVLLKELMLRRCENEVLTGTVAERTKAGSMRDSLEKDYRNQLEQLKALAPWMGEIEKGVNLRGVRSDLIEGIKQYQALDDHRLLDGVFTALEIMVECRRSVQAPDVRYRAGLVLHLNAARAGLMNPEWRPLFKPSELARIDRAWASAYAAAAAEAGATLPDLESGGEYEKLGHGDTETRRLGEGGKG